MQIVARMSPEISPTQHVPIAPLAPDDAGSYHPAVHTQPEFPLEGFSFRRDSTFRVNVIMNSEPFDFTDSPYLPGGDFIDHVINPLRGEGPVHSTKGGLGDDRPVLSTQRFV